MHLTGGTTHMNALTSINVFRQVVERGSFVGAAERLDLSVAMVSEHVLSIEKRLPVRLLNPNTHKGCELAPSVPRQEYIDRAPYGALDRLRLHSVHHAQQHALQQFGFKQAEEVHGGGLGIGGAKDSALH
jgi:regulatory helix-turn-helix LysR family protein